MSREQSIIAGLTGRRRVLMAAVAIAAAGVVAYRDSFAGAMVFDDTFSIVRNGSIRQLWPPWSLLTPAPECTVAGRPLANLSFALNYAAGGTALWGYHAVNLAIHVCAGLALFGMTRRLLRRAGPPVRPAVAPTVAGRGEAGATWLALAAALLWTVHPVQTGTVTYLSQRTESLMALCYLLTFYGFLRGVESGRRRWWAVSVGACLLGVTSKESMVTAPVMVGLYDLLFVAGSWRELWRRRWRYYAGLLASWPLLALLMTTGLGQRGVGYGLGVAWWRYALTESQAIVTYLHLAVWPHPLVFDYGVLYLDGAAAALPWVLGLAAAVAGGMFLWRRAPRAGFAALTFLLVLAPTSSVVPVAKQPIAENRLYLPLAALAVLGVAGAHTVLGRRCLPPVLALAAGWCALAAQRNTTYRDEIALWRDNTARRPTNPRSHNNLGDALTRHGRPAEALEPLERAVQMQPDYADAHYNLGTALQTLDRHAEAVACYERALRLEPDSADTHNNLGNSLAQLGRPADAIAHFERALQLRPAYPEALSNLGNAFGMLGRTAESAACYERALRLQAGLAEVHYNLANALVSLGKPAEALAHYGEALRLQPGLAAAHYNLGVALRQLGRRADAIASFERALRAAPDYVEAYNNLGVVLFEVGRTDDAIRAFESALRLQPGNANARDNLALVRAKATASRAR